jgi:hypothetical protein
MTWKRFQYQSQAFLSVVPAVATIVSTIAAATGNGPLFSKTIVYQTTAETPVVTVAETITADKWYNEFSRPVLRKPNHYHVGHYASQAATQEGSFDNGEHADWRQPLSEPIVKTKKLPTHEQQVLAFVDWTNTNNQRWLSSLSEPTRRIPSRLEQFSWAPTEIVDTGKWFAGLREPLVKKLFLATANQQVIAFVDWQPIADSASQRWLYEISVPTRRPVRIAGEFYYAPYVTPAEDVTLDKWYESLSEPRQRPKWLESRYHPYQAYTGSDPFPESVTADRWRFELSHPVRRSVRGQTDPIYTPFVVTAETITVDKWYQEFGQPKRAFRLQVDQPYSPFIAETITLDKWFVSMSDPTRRIPTRLGEFTYNTTEIVQVSKWFAPLSEWPRQKPTVRFQQDLAFVKAAPFPESVSIDRFQIGLSEPRRPLYSGLGHWYQQAYSAPAFTPVAEITVSATIEEPGVIFTQTLMYQGLAHYPFPQPTAASINPDSYYVRWLDTKRIPRAQQYQYTALAPTEIVVEPEWFEPLTERPIVRRLPVSDYQYLAFVKADPFPETVSADRLIQGISLPTRSKPYTYQTNLVWPTFVGGTATDLRVFTGWDYPLRREWRGRFPTREQQTIAFVKAAPFPETVSVSAFTQPLSGPRRRIPFKAESYFSPAKWIFATGPTTVVELLTSVVFTVVLPHRSGDGGAYGEFSYGEHTLDRPASFTIKVIKMLRDRIKVKIESIGDLLHIHKKSFKRFAYERPASGAGSTDPASGTGLTPISSGTGDVEPTSGEGLVTPQSGQGDVKVKPDP